MRSSPFKGKTLEEIHGKERANQIRVRMSASAKVKVFSPEHRKHIGVASKRVWGRPEVREKASRSHRGRKQTEQWNKRKSESLKRFYRENPEARAEKARVLKEEKLRSLERIYEDPALYAKFCRKQSSVAKMAWKKKEYRDRILKGLFSGMKPSGLEKRTIDFFNRHNLPFDYVGNGKLMVGRKCPDFVNNNGVKIFIEVANFGQKHGAYGYVSKKQYELERIRHFSKYGFRTLVVWEEELKDELTLVARINEFIGGK